MLNLRSSGTRATPRREPPTAPKWRRMGQFTNLCKQPRIKKALIHHQCIICPLDAQLQSHWHLARKTARDQLPSNVSISMSEFRKVTIDPTRWNKLSGEAESWDKPQVGLVTREALEMPRAPPASHELPLSERSLQPAAVDLIHQCLIQLGLCTRCFLLELPMSRSASADM